MTELRDRLQTSLGASYTLERELGGGGMSRVFVATERALGRQVVVKLIAPELREGLSAERFAREVQVAARLQQANIVPVLAAGVLDDGSPYYTMPYVDGQSLRARLAVGRLSLAESLDVLRDVARALAYAHGQGVVHRDVKPENVLLSAGAAMVTDFGIAKAVSASRTQTGPGLTQAGSSLGTPAYMAPEQALGDPVDERADLYAWGAMAYELLAGAHPFAAHTTAQRLVAAQVAEMPATLRSAAPGVPAGIAALVMQCLAKDPAARPASAGEVLARLSSALTPGATPVATRRGRMWVVAVALGAVAAAVALGARAWSRTARAPTLRTVVVVPFDNLGDSTDAYFATGVSEEITTRLARIPGIRVVGRGSAATLRAKGRNVDEIARAVGAAFVLTGSVRWDRARGASANDASVRIAPSLARASSGEVLWGEPVTERLTDVFRVQSDVAERVAAALSVRLGADTRAALRRADTRDPEAREATMIGLYLLARRGPENLSAAQMQFRRALARDSMYSRAWAGLAEAISVGPTYGVPATEPPLPAARRAVALDSTSVEAWSALATVLANQSHFAEALAAVDRAVALDSTSAAAQSRRGMILLAQGKTREAEPWLRRAIALDPVVSAYGARLLWMHVADRNVDSTLALVNALIARDPSIGRIASLIAPMLLQFGRFDDAVRVCEVDRVEAPRCRPRLALLADSTRRTAALALLDSASREGPTSALAGHALRASYYAHFGETDRAFAELREAFDHGDTVLFGFIHAPWLDALKRDPRWQTIVVAGQRR